MVLLWLCGEPEGVRGIRIEGRRRRCYLSSPPWLQARLHRCAAAAQLPAQQAHTNAKFASLLVSVTQGQCFSGPFHAWTYHDECELLVERLHGPLDCFTACITSSWVVVSPLLVQHIRTDSGAHRLIEGMRKVSSTCHLFYPVFDHNIRDDLLRDESGQVLPLHAILRSSGIESSDRILCLLVPATILPLIEARLWQSLLLCARWFATPCLTAAQFLSRNRRSTDNFHQDRSVVVGVWLRPIASPKNLHLGLDVLSVDFVRPFPDFICNNGFGTSPESVFPFYMISFRSGRD